MTEKTLQWILRIALLLLLCATLGVRLVRCAMLDCSATFDGTLRWQGRIYRASSGHYREGAQLAVATDKNGAKWEVNSVVGDPEGEQFVVVRSFLDQYLYQNEAYAVPQTGAVTAAYIGGNRTTDTALLQILQQVMAADRAEKPIVCFLQDVHSYSVRFCYEGSAVAQDHVGWITGIDGEWLMARTDRDSAIVDDADGQRKLFCTPIDTKLAEMLKNSGFFDFE